MPLSNIIKAARGSQIERFDFCEIETALPEEAAPEDPSPESAEQMGEREAMAALEARVAEAYAKAMEELEETVRTRLLETERQAQELEKAAYETGYAQGQKDGFEYGKRSVQIVQEHMEKLLGELSALPAKIFEDYREWFTQTCLSITKKLVQTEMKTRPEAMIQLMNALLDEAETHQALTLYLNRNDLEILKKHARFQEWLDHAPSSLTVKTDASMGQGGCRLESEIQLLDASIETQFALMEETLGVHEKTAEVIPVA